MNPLDLVKTFLRCIETRDLGGARALLTEDFVATGPAAKPLDRDKLMQVYDGLLTAFPDWTYDIRNLEETDAEHVVAHARVSATHRHDLVLAVLALPKVAATGRVIRLPDERAEFTVRGGRISRMRVLPVHGGGIDGVLEQIGAGPAPRTARAPAI